MRKRTPSAAAPLPPDLHIHTPYSGHATGSMEETVRAAVDMGLTEMGFADHFPYPQGYEAPAPDCVIPDEAVFGVYADEVRRLRDAYADRIRIRFGAEIDHLGDRSGDQAAMRSKYSFDYVIGSVHIVRGVAIDYRAETLEASLEKFGGIDRLWEDYWDALESLIRGGGCQVIGHMDVLRKFGSFVPLKSQTGRVESLLRLIGRNGLTLEVNTGGIDRASDRRSYPSPEILKLAAAAGVDISLGSDAHAPNDVGRHFRETVAMLQSLGWTRSATFESGRKRMVPFSR
jgi:histidinol-phosphatase (PHP family)